MKLARDIAEEHYRGTDEVMARGMLENIVAAKLEPVRDALDGLVGTYKDEPPEYDGFVDMLTTGEDIRGGVEALALFDDECDHEWVDATNELVSGGEVCLKCHAVRAAPEEGS